MSDLSRFIMEEVELPLIEVVVDLEEAGYPVDAARLRALEDELRPQIAAELGAIRDVAGETFKPASPVQVAHLLFETLKLPIAGTTASGKPSTDSKTLAGLKDKHPVVCRLLRYRELTKIVGTYCGIANDVDEDGRLRVSFNQLAAATGRFSSPSLIQTLPKDDEFGVRKAFRASAGHTLVGADFKQQELVILAQVSGDDNLRNAIAEGVDLHGLAAVKLFGLECAPNDVERLHPAERSKVKAIQFGLIYGSSAYSLSQRLGIAKEEAQRLIDEYFAQFPAVKGMITDVHRRVVRDGYIDDLFGRRRQLSDARLPLPRKTHECMTEAEKLIVRRISAAKREAQNFVIQGAGATITKLAMLRCHRRVRDAYPQTRMILTLHDELQFEVPDAQVDTFAAELPGLMCDLSLERFGFKVPLRVDVKTGPSWGELAKWSPKA